MPSENMHCHSKHNQFGSKHNQFGSEHNQIWSKCNNYCKGSSLNTDDSKSNDCNVLSSNIEVMITTFYRSKQAILLGKKQYLGFQQGQQKYSCTVLLRLCFFLCVLCPSAKSIVFWQVYLRDSEILHCEMAFLRALSDCHINPMQHYALVAQLATRRSWPLNTKCDHHGLSPGVREVWDAFLHRLDPIPTPRHLK